MTAVLPYYLAGTAIHQGAELVVDDKYLGTEAFRVHLADPAAIEQAIDAANTAEPAMRELAIGTRRSILTQVREELTERTEEFAGVLCTEVGKPIKDARAEVQRAVDTFRLAAEQTDQFEIEPLSPDQTPRGKGYAGYVKRMPIGPCSFITPFNFPLNLMAHKVAPAIAMGCPFVLKPAPQAPVCGLMLAEILSRVGLPHGAFSVVPCHVEDAAPLITDDRIKLLSFTGSAAVGWMLKSKAGKKKVVLELGGNAACIIDRDADLDHAIPRVITGGFALSGQSCISVQRLFVHESNYEDAKARLISAARALPVGDPRLESTILGPLISEHDAERISEWVNEAIQAGARLLCGGRRINRSFFEATILEAVPETCRVWAEEVFGPVIAIRPFARLEEVVDAANRSRYGLQAGIFTNDPRTVDAAWNELEVGGVIVNDVPTTRLEGMPYGGVKDSGCGREGVRFAMLEMSEPRLLLKRLM